MRSLLEVFCDVDDFCQQFEPVWRQPLVASGRLQRQRARRLSVSEVMTILIVFHHSHYRTFKAFYTTHVLRHWRTEFPGLVSYSRFVEFIPSTLGPLCAYLRQCSGPVRVPPVWMRRHWRYAITAGSPSIKSLRTWRRGAAPRAGGSWA